MIRMIIATDPHGVIGVKYKYVENGSPPTGELGESGRNWYFRWKMPWYYKQDLRRFKKVTMGGVLVMGRRTFQSLPGVLPGRFHLLLTRDDGFFQNSVFEEYPEQVGYSNSFAEAIDDLKDFQDRDVWIAGGAEIYKLFLDAGAVQEIDHTIVPTVDLNAVENLEEEIRFDLGEVLDDFELVSDEVNPLDERLRHRRYRCPLPASN